jgi:hypothetical protein
MGPIGPVFSLERLLKKPSLVRLAGRLALPICGNGRAKLLLSRHSKAFSTVYRQLTADN